jgi:lantibiotic biosynthesis protein
MAAATPRGPWLPILPDGDEAHGAATAASVERALDELAAALAPAEETRAAAGDAGAQALADGPAGQALFFHYLDQARPGQGHDERALAHLETAIAATAETMTAPGLYGGFSGVAWVLEHLTGRLLEPPAPGEEDPGEEVAAALTDYLGHTPWLDEYDLISGLVGFGVWAVERAPRARGNEAAESVVRRLGELAERRDGGVTWRTPPERMMATEAASHPQGNFNLGVAHGVPGVIGVLGEMVAAGLPAGEAAEAAAGAAGVADAAGAAGVKAGGAAGGAAQGLAGEGTARELLAGAVAWLLGQRLPAGSGSVFSYSVAPGVEPMPARLAWCYGDPGVSLALLGAARAAGEPAWERQALAIARAAAVRPRDASGVVDGGLCHGAAGLAHLYNRLFQATGDPLFKAEALAWIERLMAHRRPGQGIAGWQAWRPIGEITSPNPELGWVDDRGFLTGAAGIGLALLGAVSPVEPAWDRVLLASVPPGHEPFAAEERER